MFERLAREGSEAGGFTYDVQSGARPRRGFAFSAEPGREARVPELTSQAIAEYVAEHDDALSQRGNFLGAWRGPEGDWYLDVSRVLPDREEALRQARTAGQRAVYDLGSGQEIPLAALKGGLPAWMVYQRLSERPEEQP